MSYQQQLQSLIDKKYVIGIDVSSYQANIKPINYQDVLKQQPYVSFVCVKATDGLSVDSKFQENFNNAVSANICTGAYQFFDEAGDPIRQAELFYATAKQAQFIALDYEKRKVQQIAADQCFEKFAAKVQQLFQIKPFIYMYPGFEHFPKEFAQYEPWVACYNPSLSTPPIPQPWTSIKLWQFAGTDANLKLPNGAICDYDVFMGSADEFAAYIDAQVIGTY